MHRDHRLGCRHQATAPCQQYGRGIKNPSEGVWSGCPRRCGMLIAQASLAASPELPATAPVPSVPPATAAGHAGHPRPESRHPAIAAASDAAPRVCRPRRTSNLAKLRRSTVAAGDCRRPQWSPKAAAPRPAKPWREPRARRTCRKNAYAVMIFARSASTSNDTTRWPIRRRLLRRQSRDPQKPGQDDQAGARSSSELRHGARHGPLHAGCRSPDAKTDLGSELTSINHASAYVCRPRNGGLKLSEHAFGNAIDIASFGLADGRHIEVKAGAEEKQAAFLDAVRKAACGPFKTVLGPGSDAGPRAAFPFRPGEAAQRLDLLPVDALPWNARHGRISDTARESPRRAFIYRWPLFLNLF